MGIERPQPKTRIGNQNGTRGTRNVYEIRWRVEIVLGRGNTRRRAARD